MSIKIAFCMYHIITGGIENCMLRILEKLSDDPHYQFYVVVRKPVLEDKFTSFFHKHNIKVILYENELYYGEKPQKKFLRIAWKIKKYAKKVKHHFTRHYIKKFLNSCDIIFDYFNGSYNSELKHITKPKKIIFYHASIKMYEKYMYKHLNIDIYDKFVCLTKSFHDDICKLYPPHYKNKFITIYNPIDIDNIRTLSQNSYYPVNESYFLFVGRLHEDKDHITVIDAFNKFYQKVREGKLFFIGDGPNRELITNYIESINMQDHITLIGTITNPFGYMKNSLANILSSPSEGLSTVLIEGAVVGALNVSSDCPSCAAEILLDGEAGLLFPIGDSDALADIMLKIWHKEIDREWYINNAYKSLNRFEAQHVIPHIIKLIKNV